MDIGALIARLVRRIFKTEAAKLRTNTVCQVISYDAATNLVNIQPCIKAIRTDDTENTTVQLPPVEDVPVFQWGSGDVLCTCAPVIDSYGLYIVSDRRLENWITLGGIVDPGSAIKHDLSQGFFLPGLYPNTATEKITPAVDTASFQIRTADGVSYISLDGTTGIVSVNGDTDFAVAYTDLKTAFDTLRTELNAFVTIFNAHVHPGVTAGAASTAVSVTPGIPAAADMTAAQVPTVKLP